MPTPRGRSRRGGGRGCGCLPGCGCGFGGCGCGGTLLTLAVVAALLVIVHWRHGGGEPYSDILARSTPAVDASALEVVVASPEPIGNVAVAASGRVFYTLHPEARPAGAKLLEWSNGAGRPWPDEAAQARFTTPLGVVVDRQDRLWVVDHGLHGLRRPALFAFDVGSGRLVHEHRFDATVAPFGSFVQDLQVAPDGETVYLADASILRQRAGLIVYRPATGAARRLLDGHPAVSAQRWILRPPGRALSLPFGLAALHVGVDGIAIDPVGGQWLAWGAMTHDTLYRIPTAALLDEGLAPEVVAARVERLGPKPLSDGMSADLQGGILLTDPEHGAVVRRRPDGTLETLVRAPQRIRWADALSFGPDGWLYVADSAIQDQLLRSRRRIRERGPYHVYRFRPEAAGMAGQ